jgi:hypothetical protein
MSKIGILCLAAFLSLPVVSPARGHCRGRGHHGQAAAQCQNCDRCENCKDCQNCKRQQNGKRAGAAEKPANTK